MKAALCIALLVTCAALSFPSGCGRGRLPPGETGTVSGRVTCNGAPVPAGTTVIFLRSEGGITGTGTTDADGRYTLSMREEPKILVGSYRVAVTPPDPYADLSEEQLLEISTTGVLPEPVEVECLSERYRNPESSPLRFDVIAGANWIDVSMMD